MSQRQTRAERGQRESSPLFGQPPNDSGSSFQWQSAVLAFVFFGLSTAPFWPPIKIALWILTWVAVIYFVLSIRRFSLTQTLGIGLVTLPLGVGVFWFPVESAIRDMTPTPVNQTIGLDCHPQPHNAPRDVDFVVEVSYEKPFVGRAEVAPPWDTSDDSTICGLSNISQRTLTGVALIVPVYFPSTSDVNQKDFYPVKVHVGTLRPADSPKRIAVIDTEANGCVRFVGPITSAEYYELNSNVSVYGAALDQSALRVGPVTEAISYIGTRNCPDVAP